MARTPIDRAVTLGVVPIDTTFSIQPLRMNRHLPDVVEIMNLRAEHFDEPARRTLEAVTVYWETQANFNPSRDAVVALADGRIVAFARVHWYDENNGPRVYFHDAHVHPGWFRRGIGTALLDWLSRRIDEMASAHAVRPAERRTMTNDFDEAPSTMLPVAGYHRTGSDATLIRPKLTDVPEAELPMGLEIRPVTEHDYRAIYRADVEAFRNHRGVGDQGEAGWQRFRFDPRFDPTLWKVAWHGDSVVGQVRTFVDQEENQATGRRRAWTEDISVQRDWRNQGVARALICASLRDLHDRGFEEAALSVHTENPTGAFHLYTDMGYQVVSTFTEWSRRVE